MQPCPYRMPNTPFSGRLEATREIASEVPGTGGGGEASKLGVVEASAFAFSPSRAYASVFAESITALATDRVAKSEGPF